MAPETAAPTPAAATVISLQGVKKAFGEKVVLDGVDLEVRKSEILVILGRSGVGKSLTLKVMCGLVPPDEGSVSVFRQDVRSLDERGLRDVEDQPPQLDGRRGVIDAHALGLQLVAHGLVELELRAAPLALAPEERDDRRRVLLEVPDGVAASGEGDGGSRAVNEPHGECFYFPRPSKRRRASAADDVPE